MFYRKYRPQNLTELDTQSVKDQLMSILKSPVIPHAFLFTGPRGTGKTSTARIVAKILNAETNKDKIIAFDVDPQDPQVKAISEGNSADVIEIDAASNRKIDDVRELISQLKFSPLAAKYKVYIIDEVHMLTKEAFNALLKSLEEPPTHTIFILATTEVDALPKTIVSRCMRIHFNKAQRADILHMLTRIAQGEHIAIEQESLELIAHIAEGSFRDAAKTLEIVALGGNTSLQSVQHTLGIYLNTVDLLAALTNKDTAAALTWIKKAAEQGSDFKFVIEQMLDTLHAELLSRHGLDTARPELAALTVKQLAQLISLLQKAYTQLKITPIASLPLEMAAVEYCSQQEATIKN
ncbi:MAG: DNA polymerase III subunit tau [Microgenomates bacterium OLB23]|nr:MAG: DNA polymerase III subunit tau [Microgenomates bacterium OLB23]